VYLKPYGYLDYEVGLGWAVNPLTEISLGTIYGNNRYVLTGAKYETIDRNLCDEVNTAVLSSGRLSLQAIYIPAGTLINSISFWSATTAGATLTNQLFGLYDNNRNLLATSVNNTNTAWAANSRKTLALTAPFTFGNVLRILGNRKFYLKNALVVEQLAKVDSIVFDKTGTITQHHQSVVTYNGDTLSQEEQQLLLTVTRQSSHPLSRLIYETMRNTPSSPVTLADFKEYPGKGLKARSQSMELVIGSTAFVNDPQGQQPHNSNETQVHVRFSTGTRGVFLFSNQYREGMKETVQGLRKNSLDLFVLSGDNDAERLRLQDLFGSHTGIHFRKTPQEKLEFIETLQQEKRQVLMMGDGLNDAGALQQGQVGVAVTDNTNQFSPASDAILDGAAVHKLDRFILYARSSKAIISGIFVLSILYNIVGMYYATQALLSPLIAAILMPVSSISIVLCAALFSTLSARRLGL
jgi:Cu+-exporting ATPase